MEREDHSMEWKPNPLGIEFMGGTELYSMAVRLPAGRPVLFSGIIPKQTDGCDLAAQVADVLGQLLERFGLAGLTVFNLIKISVALFGPDGKPTTSAAMYDEFNALYRAWLAEHGVELPPVRFCAGASWVPKDSLIELVPECFEPAAATAV